MILIIGALEGLFSVFFGAHIEHTLREFVSEEQYRQLMTGIRYNQLNSIIICSIGLAVIREMSRYNPDSYKPLAIPSSSVLCFSVLASMPRFLWIYQKSSILRQWVA